MLELQMQGTVRSKGRFPDPHRRLVQLSGGRETGAQDRYGLLAAGVSAAGPSSVQYQKMQMQKMQSMRLVAWHPRRRQVQPSGGAKRRFVLLVAWHPLWRLGPRLARGGWR